MPKRVTVAIAAVVESINDPDGILCADVAPGDTITGTYTFDPKATDSNPEAFIADYFHTGEGYGISLDVGDEVVRTDPDNVNFLVELVNDYPADGSDSYVIQSNNNLRLECGTEVDFISWQLDDPSGKALKNTSLEEKAPSLKKFESSAGLNFDARDENGARYDVHANVTSAEVVD
jgi:hypothetical protein